MTRRMIDSGMWSNENFAALPAMARLLQVGIINHADDQGRIKAHPAYLRSQIFPYDDVAIGDMCDWLQAIAGNGTIVIYEADSKEYIQLANWWEYQSLQYASPSEYPAPDAWRDRIRYNAKGAPNLVLTHNWITTKGERLPDTCDQRGNIVGTPLHKPPSQPPGAQGGEPPSQPPQEPVESPNKLNLIELNTIEDQSSSPLPPSPLPEPTGDDDDPCAAYKSVVKAWEGNIGMITQHIGEQLGALVDEIGALSVIHGIHVATEANVRTYRYVQSCARNHANGVEPPAKNSSTGALQKRSNSAMFLNFAAENGVFYGRTTENQ